MTRIFTWLCVVALSLCSAASLKAQTLVGTSNSNFPIGCLTLFTPLSANIPVQGPATPVSLTDSIGDVSTIIPFSLTFLPFFQDLECADGVSVDFGGVLKLTKNTGGIRFSDGTTLSSASQLTGASGSRVWSSFAIAFAAKYTISTFTPDNNITVTRLQVQVPIAPSHCSTNAVLSLNNGTTTANLTVNALANDSGPVSFNFASATPITLAVSTPADCLWGIPPAAANIVVEYKVTQ